MTELTIIEFDLEVDASGLNCPLPLLRLKKALMEVQSGDVIKIIATDPAAHLDIGVYVDQTGHQLLELTKEVNVQVFFIRKK
jgi:tRNA 2-thiouridine synthesizing protein A